MLLPALHSARMRAKNTECLSNMKQIGTYAFQYGNDYDDWGFVGMTAISAGADHGMIYPNVCLYVMAKYIPHKVLANLLVCPLSTGKALLHATSYDKRECIRANNYHASYLFTTVTMRNFNYSGTAAYNTLGGRSLRFTKIILNGSVATKSPSQIAYFGDCGVSDKPSYHYTMRSANALYCDGSADIVKNKSSETFPDTGAAWHCPLSKGVYDR